MSAPRGQNLVLLTMGLFLITLMVTTTLGIASRVKDNHELQTLADAAAYSSAVVNARAYNNAALLNRVQVAQWVTMAADESLIDWTSYTRAALGAAHQQATEMQSLSGHTNSGCNVTTPAINLTNRLDLELNGGFIVGPNWDKMDDNAGDEAQSVQGAIGAMRDQIHDDMTVRLFFERSNQLMAKAMVARAQLPGVKVIEGPGNQGPNGVSRREAGCPAGSPGTGSGLCRNSEWGDRMRDAALGSRTDAFLRFRGVVPAALQARFDAIRTSIAGIQTLALTPPVGEGYWADGLEGVNSRQIAFGDDHSGNAVTITLVAPGGACSATNLGKPAISRLVSTHIDDNADEHTWDPVPNPDNRPPKDRHTMGSCQPNCPSVWVRTSNFNAGPTNDANGQPKVVVALERDYTQVQRPWELNFDFHFSPTGSRFDNRGERLVSQNIDISKASAFATGMTYYHRRQPNPGDRWQEFPNLLNPFWRATLVPADVDRDTNVPQPSSSDVQDVDTTYFQPAHTWQADVYREMVVNGGFKGLH
ncbi:MAG: hypothetical protein K1X89_13915 [Myxococcaceae bacterium]|nr:hypothetical protein [Myxococcaceae bacterium]